VMSAHLNRPRPRARIEATETLEGPQPNCDPTALGQVSDRANPFSATISSTRTIVTRKF
jgi:hypothetical protein